MTSLVRSVKQVVSRWTQNRFSRRILIGASVLIIIMIWLAAYGQRKVAIDGVDRSSPAGGPAVVDVPTTIWTEHIDEASPKLKSMFLATTDRMEWTRTFYLCWTTGENTWTERHDWIIYSILLHQPDANIIMFTTEVQDSFFARFRDAGYRVRAVVLGAEYMLQYGLFAGPGSRAWLESWSRWQDSPYFYSHLTDYIRMSVLLMTGGTYMDMDALVLRPLPAIEFVGADLTDGKCPWCFTLEEHQTLTGEAYDHRRPRMTLAQAKDGILSTYLAPGFMRLAPGHRFLAHALESSFDPQWYRPDCFNCVGPRAFTSAFKAADKQDVSSIRVLPWHQLYPHSYLTVSWVLDYDIFGPAEAQSLMDTSLSLHLYGHVTRRLPMAAGSTLDVLVHQLLGLPATGQEGGHLRLSAPPVYVHTSGKEGNFIARDAIRLWGSSIARRPRSVRIRADSGLLGWAGQGAPVSELRVPAEPHTLGAINRVLATLRYTHAPAAVTNEPLVSVTDTFSDKMPSVAPNWQDRLTITIEEGDYEHTVTVPVIVMHRAITVVTKTMMGRMHKVCNLAQSVRSKYAGLHFLVGDDSGETIERSSLCPALVDPDCVGRECAKAVWHSLPYDTGLSKSRNTLVAMARTPFVFMTDDDFVLDWDSRLDALLEQALLQEADIVAGKIPEDMQLYVDFAGVISVADGALELKGGFLGNAGTCQRVEFVPNVFVGRRSKLMAISWDPDLKLGEHEDFFLRAKQKNAVVLTCLHIGIHHKQDKWYSPERKDEYAKLRQRVFGFMEMALRKHGLTKLISFKSVVRDLTAPKAE